MQAIYFIIIIILPFLTFWGFGLFLFLPVIILLGLLTSAPVFLIAKSKGFETRDFSKNSLSLYIMSLLLFPDGGDGSQYLGISVLIGKLTGKAWQSYSYIFSQEQDLRFGMGGPILLLVFMGYNLSQIVKFYRK